MNTTGMTKEKLLIVTLPNTLTFKHKGIIDFDNILKLFRWDYEGNSVTIDARQCKMGGLSVFNSTNSIYMVSKKKPCICEFEIYKKYSIL